MGLRASPPAAQGRTWPRPLRRPILAWPAPPRAHDDDRLRLPAKPPPRRGERGKKESAKGRPSRHCPRSAAPCSPFSLARRPIDVPIAGEPSEDTSNKSAKVVIEAKLVVLDAHMERAQARRMMVLKLIGEVREARAG